MRVLAGEDGDKHSLSGSLVTLIRTNILEYVLMPVLPSTGIFSNRVSADSTERRKPIKHGSESIRSELD